MLQLAVVETDQIYLRIIALVMTTTGFDALFGKPKVESMDVHTSWREKPTHCGLVWQVECNANDSNKYREHRESYIKKATGKGKG
jgi:hypothetical protein